MYTEKDSQLCVLASLYILILSYNKWVLSKFVNINKSGCLLFFKCLSEFNYLHYPTALFAKDSEHR